jgi:hypothetical protein
MKRCTKCGLMKRLEEFYRAAANRDGHRNDCIPCNAAAHRERHARNPEPARERAKKWNREHPESVAERMEAYRRSGKKATVDRASHLKRTFGIAQGDYDAMLAAQGGGCAICGRPPSAKISLHIDHDHDDGRIRGLLCFVCNNGLGQFQENPERLRKAAAYVEAGRG